MSANKHAAAEAPPDIAGSIDAVLAAIRPLETTARICLRGDLADRARRLEADIRRLERTERESLGQADELAPLLAELEALIVEMKAFEVEFRFQAAGDKPFSDLLAKYPPKNQGDRLDADAAAPELIALTCVSHPMSLEQSQALHAVLAEGDRNVLFNAAWTAASGDVRIPTSRAASARTLASD